MTIETPHHASPVGRDIRAYTDKLRAKHRVVKNTAGEWVLLRHADVTNAALDHEVFSSNVSRFLQVPNGLDGEQHTRYRKIIDRYLTKEALSPYLPVFEQVANALITGLPNNTVLDAVNDIGAVFAVRAQCQWLGWPDELEPVLLEWMKENHAATRSGEHKLTANVADKFNNIVRTIITNKCASDNVADDITTQLCRETINGKALTQEEIISILRNWTGGDLGSIALCVGVIIAHLATVPALIATIRQAPDKEVEDIIDEILRIDNPFVANRRVTTCPVNFAGHHIPKGAKVKLNWTSANRDESVFNNNQFDPKTNANNNLVYGIGKHVCPGRTLATWQLRIAVQALVNSVGSITLAPNKLPEREVFPVGGYHRVPIILTL